MIVLSWNVRGLGRPAKRATVRRLVRLHKVDSLCLQESKVHKNIESIVFDVRGPRSCGWEWVPSKRASGGLISIWNEKVLVREYVLSSPRVLAIKFCLVVDNVLCAMANIYGPNEDSERRAFWDSLSAVRIH